MANITPLTYKPGLNRDGTNFQPEYCRDGQWIRFNQGKVKKIGGMVSPALIDTGNGVSNILLLPNAQDHNKITIYTASNTKIVKLTTNTAFNSVQNISQKLINNLPVDLLWHTEIIIDDGAKKILFLATNNGKNIASNIKARLFAVKDADGIDALTEIDTNIFDSKITGGMCYVAPYLFLFGNDGFIQWSSRSNSLDFTGDGSGSINISYDKVVYARPIRGGSYSPSLLCWSLSKVVRLTNTAQGDAEDIELQVDVISNSSSILSSRAVVEYDGLFFWIGTDRFFIYNGVVQEMVNNNSINYFFNNLDMNHRQKVFGIKA